MAVSAQVSVYPLRQQCSRPAVMAVCEAFESVGLAPEVGSMSTLVRGDAERIFSALRLAFDRASALGDVAMVIAVSNACPAD